MGSSLYRAHQVMVALSRSGTVPEPFQFHSGSDEFLFRNGRTINPNQTGPPPGTDDTDHALFPCFPPNWSYVEHMQELGHEELGIDS